MKKLWLKAMVCLGLLLVLFIQPSVAGDYVYINITNPFFKKIPIAIPVFKSLNGLENELALATKGSDFLTETLNFTGYFDVLERNKFLFDPEKDDIEPENIHYNNWTVIGSELLVTGGVTSFDDLIELELRLMDTVKGRMLTGKRYKGTAANFREMILRFAGDVIQLLTGREGIFNSKIAFISNTTGNKEIYICDFDGYQPKQFTKNNNITLFPAWSTDGKWMAYTSYKNKKPDLFIRHIEENRGTIVSKNGINSTPAWSPGKFELAATLSFSGDQEIYMLTGSGKIIKRLTYSSGIDSSPTFSPDGKQMAFVSRRSGTPQVYIMDLNQGTSRRLTFNGRYNTQPNWSPLGDKIAFTAMAKGITNINVINTDGTGQVQLTHDAGENEAPSWSPEGSLIVFSSTREGKSKIYVMTALGRDQRRLLDMSGEQTNPKWSPR